MISFLRLKYGRAVALLGEAPALAKYLATLKQQQILIVLEELLDDRSMAILRQLHRPVVIVGTGVSCGTKSLVSLSELRAAGAKVITSNDTHAAFHEVSCNTLLQTSELSWVVPEIYRRFEATAPGRVHFTRGILENVQDGAWLAAALMLCPRKTNIASAELGLSSAALRLKMALYSTTWPALCDRMILEVCAYHARLGDTKASAIAEELGCHHATELSRRLMRLGSGWRALALG